MLEGGVHIVSGTPTKLDSTSKAYRSLTIRLAPNSSICYFGNSSLSGVGNAMGYLTATTNSGESWTFGPFQAGSGVRPSDIYIVGTANNVLYWNGLPA